MQYNCACYAKSFVGDDIWIGLSGRRTLVFLLYYFLATPVFVWSTILFDRIASTARDNKHPDTLRFYAINRALNFRLLLDISFPLDKGLIPLTRCRVKRHIHARRPELWPTFYSNKCQPQELFSKFLIKLGKGYHERGLRAGSGENRVQRPPSLRLLAAWFKPKGVPGGVHSPNHGLINILSNTAHFACSSESFTKTEYWFHYCFIQSRLI